MEKDTLTLTLRLHDPKEKKDAAKSAVWKTLEIPREDLALAAPDFAAKYTIEPIAAMLKQLTS